MKTLKTLAAWAVIMSAVAAGCTPITPDPPYQGGRDEAVQESPRITLKSGKTIIYDASLKGIATINFNTSRADDVKVEADFDVQIKLSDLGDGQWQAGLSEATGMEDGKDYFVTITATNEYGETQTNAVVMKAYLANPFEKDSYQVQSGGEQYFFYPDGNVEYEWKITETNGAEGMCEPTVNPNSLSFFVTRNTSLEVREVILTLKDKVGAFEYSATFSQLGRDMGEEEILAKERAAMMALYNALGGSETFHPSSNWGSDALLSTWGGVQVNSKGYVTNIVVENATGYLPEEIGDLKYCWEFLVSGKLTGELPKRIGEMEKLKELLIMCDEGYALSGQLSESTLSNIASNLRYIRLPNHNFTGPCPEWLGDTPSHCAFWINGNRLEGKVPDKVKNHNWWTSPNLTGSPERTYGEFQLQQQEGYILYE